MVPPWVSPWAAVRSVAVSVRVAAEAVGVAAAGQRVVAIAAAQQVVGREPTERIVAVLADEQSAPGLPMSVSLPLPPAGR